MVEPQGRISNQSLQNTSASSVSHSHSDSQKSQTIYERQSPQTYSSTKVAGNGTFGVVYQSIIPETGETVAIKKVLQDTRYKNRELDIHKDLSHPNIVCLLHSFFTPGTSANELFLNLVLEYYPDTLYKYLRSFTRQHNSMPLLLLKLYSYQLLRSLNYCHSQGICHRDIKPQNLLVDPSTHRLALCDFGSAKRLVRGEPNIAYICSRYYRAPELCLGATEYTTAVDMWSAGCVIAEMFLGNPLFPGESATDQIVEIIKVLGRPSREMFFDMNCRDITAKLPDMKGMAWMRAMRGKAPQEAAAFLEYLLVYSPGRRPTALQAMQHCFFDEIRRRDARLPNGMMVAELINLTESERKLLR